MLPPEGTLLNDELEMRRYYFEDFREPFFDLPKEVYNFLSINIFLGDQGEVEDLTEDKIVCLLIYTRIMQDLRSVQMCAGSGYSSAAASIATSVVELCYEIAYIAGDLERANEWFEHDDLRKTVEEHHNRTGNVLKSSIANRSDRSVYEDEEWQYYRFLSAVKHGNSVLQKMMGYTVEQSNIVLDASPKRSDYMDSLSQIVIALACLYSLKACSYFALQYNTDEQRSQLGKKLSELMDRVRSSLADAAKRFNDVPGNPLNFTI